MTPAEAGLLKAALKENSEYTHRAFSLDPIHGDENNLSVRLIAYDKAVTAQRGDMEREQLGRLAKKAICRELRSEEVTIDIKLIPGRGARDPKSRSI